MAVGYATIVLIALAMIRLLGDRWWPATLLIYGPRFLLPLAAFPLIGWAVRRRSWRSAGAIGTAAAIAAGPVMGLTFGFGEGRAPASGGAVMRVLTFNRGGGTVDLRAFHDLLDREQIDLVFLQETTNDPALRLAFPEGWNVNKPGTIATRLEIAEDLPDPGRDHGGRWFWPIRADHATLVGRSGRRFVAICGHLPTIRYGLERLAVGDLAGFEAQADWRAKQMGEFLIELNRDDLPVIAGADLNTPPESRLLDPIRRRYRVAFDCAGLGYGYTSPTRFPFARIDHVLVGPEWSVGRCWVGPDLGSDHRPMIAEVTLAPGAGL